MQAWLHSNFDIIHAANPPDIAFLIAPFHKLLAKTFAYDQDDLAPELYYVYFGAGVTRLSAAYWSGTNSLAVGLLTT